MAVLTLHVDALRDGVGVNLGALAAGQALHLPSPRVGGNHISPILNQTTFIGEKSCVSYIERLKTSNLT